MYLKLARLDSTDYVYISGVSPAQTVWTMFMYLKLVKPREYGLYLCI